jgi:hypothetical protein
VRAVDLAGNVDSTPATRSFTVNASPPNTLLTGNPGPFHADTTPTWSFSSTIGGSTFECAVAAGHALPLIEETDFSSCTSSFTSSPLADGEYTFELDTDAPDGVIVQAPSGTITDHTPDFQVSTDEPDDIAEGEFTMTCQITGSPPQSTPCDENAFSFSDPLPDGTYTFTLQVQDLLGRQDGTPATATFTVATPPPPPPDTGGQQQPGGQTTPKRCKKGQKLKQGKCVKKKRKKRK